jgi:hypothetical protein
MAMKVGTMLLAAVAAAALGGCNPSAETSASNQAANAAASSAAAAKPKHPTYCFFKDADTKSWRAARDGAGNVTVKGKAHLEDTRYMAGFGEPEIAGTSARLWLTMNPNTGPYGAPGDWWDVSSTVSGSSAVDSVTILCGTKTVAQLKVSGRR